jgi:hypothetical protein
MCSPPPDFVKVNWDAIVDKMSKKMGIGVIVCDSKGEVMATLSTLKAFIFDPAIAKAIAALRAVTFSRELRFYKAILEGDALQVVQALKKDGTNWSKYGHLTEEAKGLLQCLQSWWVSRVCRHLNGAAHRLPKNAVLLGEEQALIGEIPSCIYEIIYLEHCT